MRPRITLIAQGTTKAMRAATFGADDGLDAVGRRHATRLARSLVRVDRAFVSPALASRDTAEALGLDAAVEPALRDCDYGKWTGLTFNQVLLRAPRKLMRWIKNPEDAPHGGETIPEVRARVAAWFQTLSRADGHTVAVTHSAVIRAAIVHVIQAEPVSFWRIDVLPLAQADFRTNGRRWVFRSLAVPEGNEDNEQDQRDER